MNEALVYLSAILFLIAIFPVHIINYIYISTGEKYASVNVTVYRLFTLLNINTVRPPEPQNGKNEEKEETFHTCMILIKILLSPVDYKPQVPGSNMEVETKISQNETRSLLGLLF